MVYNVEIIQTIKVIKKISAGSEADALRKGNSILAEDKIPFEQYQLVDATVKTTETSNLIPFIK